MHNDKGNELCGENKPEIIHEYSSTKIVVDTMGQMARHYSIKQMTPTWLMVVLLNKMDISAMIAIIIWMKLRTSLEVQKGVRRVCLLHYRNHLEEYHLSTFPLFRHMFHPIRFLSMKIRTREGGVTCVLQKRTGNLRYTATTVNREFVVNTASMFAFSKVNKIQF